MESYACLAVHVYKKRVFFCFQENKKDAELNKCLDLVAAAVRWFHLFRQPRVVLPLGIKMLSPEIVWMRAFRDGK